VPPRAASTHAHRDSLLHKVDAAQPAAVQNVLVWLKAQHGLQHVRRHIRPHRAGAQAHVELAPHAHHHAGLRGAPHNSVTR